MTNPLTNFLGMFNYTAPRTTGTPTSGGTLVGADPGSAYDPAYGGVPQVPTPGATQTDALLSNLGQLSNLYRLAIGAGKASAGGAETQLDQNLPGYAGARDKSMANINSLLSGQIPEDVVRQLSQRAAERGVAIGSPGSPNSMAALLQALGLTSLGLQQQGEQALTGAVGRTPRGPNFDPSTMLLNPQAQQEWQYLANLLKAAPVPGSAAAANLRALRQGVGAGQGGGRSGTPFNYVPPNPFQADVTSPFRGGTPAYPSAPITDFANMSEEDMMNYITGFPAGWRAGEALPGTPTTPYDESGVPYAGAYTPPGVGDLFPGFGVGYGGNENLGPVGGDYGGYAGPGVGEMFPGFGADLGLGTDYTDLYNFGG